MNKPLAAVAFLLLSHGGLLYANTVRPPIFPLPQEIETTEAKLVLDDAVRVLLPIEPTEHDLLLAREITAELVNRFGVAPQTQRVSTIPENGRFIVMGTGSNPLLRQLAGQRNVVIDAKQPGPEGYVLQVDGRVAWVAGSDEPGAFYGMQSLRQLVAKSGREVSFRGVRVRDWPHKSFRGLKIYLPGPDNIGFYKRFVRDFMALNKYNQLILEMNANMRLDKRPELNAGSLDLAQDLINTRRDRPFGPKGEVQDSVHHDNADGAILEKSEVAELVRWARQYHIDVIPELPTLSHAYHLVTRQRDVAEMRDAEWPDAYCPSNPKSYEVAFDVLGEYIEVMKPKIVHVGHDEWRIRIGTCPDCSKCDIREVFADDLVKIHGWLKQRGIVTMIWGDHLIERLRGKITYNVETKGGFKYQRPGGLSAEMVRARVPKDIIIANWFWQEPHSGQGEVNDIDLEAWGFRQFYGNMEPHLQNWGRRSARASVMGGAPSSWAATTEFNFGKDQVFEFMACANLLWSKTWPGLGELTAWVQASMPDVRERFSGRAPFSASGDPQSSVKLSTTMAPAKVRSGHVRFELDSAAAIQVAAGGASQPIPIGQDVSSLVFLHASDKPATRSMAYRIIHNFEDTADLLGFYEVLYEDGFVVTVPLRYGVNILEQSWTAAKRPRTHCYLADPVELGAAGTFHAYEWQNPRLGKSIRSVTLKGVSGFVTARGQKRPDTTITLQAITMIKPRPIGRSQRITTENLDD